MNCEEFKGMLDAFIDDELDAAQRAQLIKHAEACPSCAKELRDAQALKRALAELDASPIVPLPAQAAWRTAVKKEARRRKLKYVYRTAGAVAAAFVVLVGSTFAFRSAGLLDERRQKAVLSAESSDAPLYYGEARADERLYAAGATALETDGEADIALEEAADVLMLAEAPSETASEKMDYAAEEAEAVESESAAPTEETLLARSAFREIYTESASFDAAHAQVADLAGEYGGYLLEDAVTTAEGAKSAEMLAAVPQEDLEPFLAALDYLGTVTQAELNAEDITLNYYDAQGRLETLSTERDRLQALIAEATDAEEIAALDAQLEDVFARIDALEANFRTYEDELQLARVRILLHEGEPGAIGAAPDEKLNQRMNSGFQNTLSSLKRFFSDMAVSLAVLAPVAAIVLPVVIAIWVIAAVLIKRHRRAREEI